MPQWAWPANPGIGISKAMAPGLRWIGQSFPRLYNLAVALSRGLDYADGRLMRLHTVVATFCLAAFATLPLEATPFIFYRGVIHAASFAPPGSPASGIPQGGLFSIFGQELGPAQGVQVSAFPLETELAGVSVSVTQGATTVDAIPVFVFAGQVNVIMPSNAPTGLVTIRVTFNGDASNPVTARVVAHNPGIFTVNQSGIGPGIVQNFVSGALPINSTATSAERGQLVIVWLSGLGAIQGPDGEAPPVGTLPYGVQVFVGGVEATNITYAGRTPCCSAVDQINVFIPENAPTGCFVPLTVRVNGFVSNTTTIAIGESGGCNDAHNPFAENLVAGGKQGVVALVRQDFSDETVAARPTEGVLDWFLGFFADQPANPFAFSPEVALPPPGSCTSYTMRGDILEDPAIPGTPRGDLATGLLTVTTPAGTTQAFPTALPPSAHGALLGHNIDLRGLAAAALQLGPGSAMVASAGGADVDAFEAQADIAEPVTWTNRAALEVVERSAGARFTWTGDAQVIVGGVTADLPTNSSAVFACVAPPGSNSFDVPDYALANLPTSRATANRSHSYLVLLSIPSGQPAAFEAAGLDYGGAVSVHLQMRGVVVR